MTEPTTLAAFPLTALPVANGRVDANLLDHEDDFLPGAARERLWEIFVEIGRAWDNVPNNSAGLRSSWLEFIHAKTKSPPCYVGEYANAISVIQELTGRLRRDASMSHVGEPICGGTLLSRSQFLTDIRDWGYLDARLTVGAMNENEIEAWTAAIQSSDP